MVFAIRVISDLFSEPESSTVAAAAEPHMQKRGKPNPGWHVSDCSCCLWSPSGTCHCSHGSLVSLWSLWSHPQVHRMKNGLSNPGLHFHLFSEYPRTGEDCFLQHRALCQSAVARTRAGPPLQGQWRDVVFLRWRDACSGTSGTVNRSSTWLP